MDFRQRAPHQVRDRHTMQTMITKRVLIWRKGMGNGAREVETDLWELELQKRRRKRQRKRDRQRWKRPLPLQRSSRKKEQKWVEFAS